MIVLYNPHIDDFLADPPHFRLVGRRPLKKYSYILDGIISKNGKIEIYADGTASAFVPARVLRWLPRFARKLICELELWLWIRDNTLSGKVRRVRGPSEATGKTLLLFSYKGATGLFEERWRNLRDFQMVIAHLSHYFICADEKARNLSRLENVILAGDSDITQNPFFRKHYGWYRRQFLMVPFVVANRFQVKRPHGERQKRAVATGTIHDLYSELPAANYRDYLEFFQLPTYHPTRKLIYDNAADIAGSIESHVSYYRGSGGKGGALSRIAAHFAVGQKQYFKLDIVALYNSFRYAIVGEEAAGFPALGAFEAMACGCVLIAVPSAYAGWDMYPGTHFVAHDGSLPSLHEAISALNEDPQRAVKIASAGAAFVNSYFRSGSVFAALEARLREISLKQL